MDLESVIETIASLVAIYAFAKNDTSLFLNTSFKLIN